MARLTDFTVTLAGGRRAEAVLRGHRIVTDQPTDNGGDDAAPSPYELFLASLGTCAAVTLQGFCARRELPTDGLTVTQSMRYAEDGRLERVTFAVTLPGGFPEKYREAALRTVGECSVKKAIAGAPAFEVALAGEAAR